MATKNQSRFPLNLSGRVAQVVVRDHGLGVPTKDQDRIFDRFERAVSHHNISGMGLGLYIAREIAHAHGGRIILESEVQKRFHVHSGIAAELTLASGGH